MNPRSRICSTGSAPSSITWRNWTLRPRQMDTAYWDDAYTNSAYIPGGDRYAEKWASDAALFRESMTKRKRAQLDQPYGSRPRERFDLFLPEAQPRGLSVFVHGGYWMLFDKSSWSHLATGALDRGW